MKAVQKQRKVLAVASGGGHWVQLLRTLPALDGHEIVFVTVNKDYQAQVPGYRFYEVTDATLWNKLRLLKLAAEVAWVVVRERPDFVISTGAAPGYFALVFGKLFRAKTIWLDSVTNIERLSISGGRVGRFADLWLTQWEHLSKPKGPQFGGAVL